MKSIPLLLLICTLINFGCSSKSELSSDEITNSKVIQQRIPLLKGRVNENVLKIHTVLADSCENLNLTSLELILEEGSQCDFLDLVEAELTDGSANELSRNLFGKSSNNLSDIIVIDGSAKFGPGTNTLSVHFTVKGDGLLEQSFRIGSVVLNFEKYNDLILEPEQDFTYRPALMLRSAGQDNCDTYRIPGLITTNENTLISVYDNRYNNSKDLQEDVDIGMSRSTDGGQSWEPMKVIMDMGEWGVSPERLNGVGDPAILYDTFTSTIWVIALWMNGLSEKDMLWWASEPGMEPTETGQLLLVKSIDDGLTWSDPINITTQVKDPSWQLLLQGPGRGITMNDGTLVFPAQFKADIGQRAIDGGEYTCHSTIIYSQDQGESWNIGSGAKPNTTEAQVVELNDGKLMLNMRDDRNRKVKDNSNGRAVATSSDMGQTWEIHSTSNSALPESNCMASIISSYMEINNDVQKVLFFSNPNNKNKRKNMTIKGSLDQGASWPAKYQVELNEQQGYGYSCMSMVNENAVGIVYEGVKELYFQTVPVDEILGYIYK